MLFDASTMNWRRGAAIAGLALALLGGLPAVRAEPTDTSSGTVSSGARTSTKLRPQHTLHAGGEVDAVAGTAEEEVGGPEPAPPEPAPLDELPPINEIPPPPEPDPEPEPSSRPPGLRPYGRKDPLLPHVRLDSHVALTWEGAFGVGARVDWLLIEGTFTYSSRDELAVSAGCDVTFVKLDGSQLVEVFPTAVLQWSIGVDDRLFLYPEFGFLGHVDGGQWDGLYPNIGFGSRYYLSRSVGLHARFGWPIAFSAGAVF